MSLEARLNSAEELSRIADLDRIKSEIFGWGFIPFSEPNDDMTSLIESLHIDPERDIPVYEEQPLDYRYGEKIIDKLKTTYGDHFRGGAFGPSHQDRLISSLFLSRLTNLKPSSTQEGAFEDGRRRYSDEYLASHVFYAGLAAYLATGNPELFIIGLNHDNVEDNKVLDKLAKKIERKLKQKNMHDRSLCSLLKQADRGEISIQEAFANGNKDLQDDIQLYFSERERIATQAADFIYGNAPSTDKSRFKDCVIALTHAPWETYFDYLDRIFDVEDPWVRDAAILVKLVDKLHNTTTDFDYRTSDENLVKRIRSFNETSYLISKVKGYMRDQIADYLICSTRDSSMPFLEFDYTRFKAYLRDRPKESDKKEDFDRLLSMFESVDISALAEKNPFFESIYAIHATLTSAMDTELADLEKHLTKERTIGRPDLKDVMLRKSASLSEQMVMYFEVGGYYKTTPEGYLWRVDNDLVQFDFDGFTERINRLKDVSSLDKYYLGLKDPDGIGLGMLLRDIMAFRGIFNVYGSKSLVLSDKGYLYTPDRGNGWLCYTEPAARGDC